MALAVMLGALGSVLARVVASADFQERAAAAVRERLHLELDYQELALGFLPPRVRVLEPRLLASDGRPDVLAREVAARVEILPLLRGQLVVEQVAVEGAHFEIVRTGDGLRLRSGVPLPTGGRGGAAAKGKATSAEGSDEPGLVLRRVLLRDGSVRFEDRTVQPSQQVALSALRLDLRQSHGSLVFDGDAQVSTGGSLNLRGERSESGAVAAEIVLEAVGLPGFGGIVGDAGVSRLEGVFAGTVRFEVDEGGRSTLDVELEIGSLALQRDELAIEGGLALQARLALPGFQGPFRFDATQATIEYGDSFHKARGERATLEGSIASGSGDAIELSAKLAVRDLDADVSGRIGAGFSLQIDSAPIEVSAWTEAIPVLASLNPEGPVRLVGLRLEQQPSGELQLGGAIELDAVRVRAVAESPSPLVLRGRVEAEGSALLLRGLRVESPGGPLLLDGKVDLLGERPGYSFDLRSPDPVESAGFLTAVSSVEDLLFGALRIDARLGGPLFGEKAITDSAIGEVHFDIGGDDTGGRLVGVSLLRGVVDQFGSLGGAALLAGPMRRGKALDVFYSEEFQFLGGSFRLSEGLARTDDLRIVYRGYTVSLQGALRLSDLELDMTGRIRLAPEIDALLSGGRSRRPRDISLAHIGGTISRPRVALTREVVAEFAGRYLLSTGLDLLSNFLNKRLSPDAPVESPEGR